jgi:RNA polymerase sigma factor (sigma-70 family)
MEELYKHPNLKANTQKFILANGGNRDDAETVFCDTIINFVKNCYKNGFEIRTNVENYFFGLTKNLWYKTIRQRKTTSGLEDISQDPESDSPEIVLINNERKQNLEVILMKLEEKCRMVLMLWARNMKMEAIAKKMHYSSAEVVRKKKHFCLKKLVELVNAHPDLLDSLKKQV